MSSASTLRRRPVAADLRAHPALRRPLGRAPPRPWAIEEVGRAVEARAPPRRRHPPDLRAGRQLDRAGRLHDRAALLPRPAPQERAEDRVRPAVLREHPVPGRRCRCPGCARAARRRAPRPPGRRARVRSRSSPRCSGRRRRRSRAPPRAGPPPARPRAPRAGRRARAAPRRARERVEHLLRPVRGAKAAPQEHGIEDEHRQHAIVLAGGLGEWRAGRGRGGRGGTRRSRSRGNAPLLVPTHTLARAMTSTTEPTAPVGAPRRADRAAHADALHALAREGARPALRRLPRRCGSGRSTTSRPSGARSGTSSTSRPDAPYERVLGDALDAGARVVPRRPPSTTPSTSSAGKAGRRPWRSCTPPSCATAARSPGASCASRSPRIAAGLRALGRGAGRSRRRLPAEHPRDRRRLPGLREPRRGVVELLAGLRRPQRGRPLRPDRAEGPASRSTATATAASTSTASTSSRGCRARCPTLARTVVLPYLAGRPDLGGLATRSPGTTLLACGAGAELEFAQVPLRPPAVGPLLVGDDGPAQGDRPRARAGSSSSTSRSSTCTSTRRRATGSSGSRPPAG